MPEKQPEAAESSAVRVALWRAIHAQVDAVPHVLEDEIGLRLVAPDAGWRSRPDMDPQGTKFFRASIVARARFIEDLVLAKAVQGISQYVILGAGLDSFAQRKPSSIQNLKIFEIDQPGPQAWKQKRLVELGYGIPEWLRFVPVNFEAKSSWWDGLIGAGFDTKQPAVVTSTGVSMYLTKEATLATLRQAATLAPGSAFAMTFLLPLEMADPEIRPGFEMAAKGAKAAGTPFISFYMPEEIKELAIQAGFKSAEHVSAATLTQRYFANRTDGLRPPENAEELIVSYT